MENHPALIKFFVDHPWAFHGLDYVNRLAHAHPLNSLAKLWHQNPNQVMLNSMLGNPWSSLQTLKPMGPQVKPGSFI